MDAALTEIIEVIVSGDYLKLHSFGPFHVRSLERIATVWTMLGISSERMTLYLAAYGLADRIAEGGGVATEHENISVVEIGLGDLAKLMDGYENTRTDASSENALS